MAPGKFSLWICLIILFVFPVPMALAEIKVFEKEVEEIVGRDQSQEQVEAFALQKAKRLAVEEAGTYLSSLTIVKNYRLEKDEITALASGVVHAKIVEVPSISVKNGVIHVRVKARIQVDTRILDRQIEEIMKEKGTLKKLEEERQKVKELEGKLARLKSSELKRLEELNSQALSIEREREKQRLILEEQSLKARGELKRAEIERLQKEREMQARITQTISEQEKARREEAEAIAREQDRLRRAQMENEQRWNELARKSRLRQAEWVPIDDRLSLRQAIEETRQLKAEIANLNQRMNVQFEESKKNLRKAFEQQITLTAPQLPPDPAPKDPFETTSEYNKRLTDHAAKVSTAKAQNQEKIEMLKAEEDFRIIQAEARYLEQRIAILEPFMKRLQSLQERKFVLPEINFSVSLGDPDADKSRFPLDLQYKEQKWKTFWSYTDRNQARDFWKTRAYLKGQGLFQLEEKMGVAFGLTGCRVTHPGTGESRDFQLSMPSVFSEISEWGKIKGYLPKIKEKEKVATLLYETGGKYRDPWTGMEFVLIKGGCFQMGDSFHENEKPAHKVCVDSFFIGKYEITQGQWRAVMGTNPSQFKNCGDNCPVEQVSWNDAQEFIRRLNLKEKTNRYRLPTEAEWEYACRAGSQSAYSFGNDAGRLGDYAWFGSMWGHSNSGNKTYPVGQKKPNAWGLYDMYGNVWEWCSDWYGSYSEAPSENPSGTSIGSHRVLRGGAYNSPPEDARCASRYAVIPVASTSVLGFRLVRMP